MFYNCSSFIQSQGSAYCANMQMLPVPNVANSQLVLGFDTGNIFTLATISMSPISMSPRLRAGIRKERSA